MTSIPDIRPIPNGRLRIYNGKLQFSATVAGQQPTEENWFDVPIVNDCPEHGISSQTPDLPCWICNDSVSAPVQADAVAKIINRPSFGLYSLQWMQHAKGIPDGTLLYTHPSAADGAQEVTGLVSRDAVTALFYEIPLALSTRELLIERVLALAGKGEATIKLKSFYGKDIEVKASNYFVTQYVYIDEDDRPTLVTVQPDEWPDWAKGFQ